MCLWNTNFPYQAILLPAPENCDLDIWPWEMTLTLVLKKVFYSKEYILMGDSNTVESSYTMYRHLQQ